MVTEKKASLRNLISMLFARSIHKSENQSIHRMCLGFCEALEHYWKFVDLIEIFYINIYPTL